MPDYLERRAFRAAILGALALICAFVALTAGTIRRDIDQDIARRSTLVLRVSSHDDRSGSVPLDHTTVPAPAFAFLEVPSVTAVESVEFFLDDPRMRRAPFRVERSAPFDVGGGAASGEALPWDVSALAPGSTHQLTHRTTTSTGRTLLGTASFTMPSTSGGGASTTTVPPTTTTAPPPPPTTGGYPTPATTGVPAGWTPRTVHSGDYTASTPGQVIDGWRITGVLTIAASNVTVRNSEVYGQVWLASNTNASGLLVEDTTIGPPSGISSWGHGMLGVKGFTARRVEIRNASDGFRVSGSNVLIEDSFFKAVQPGCAHLDGVQGYYGGTNVVLRHNTLDVRGSCATAAIFFGDSSREVQAFDNLTMGGSFVLKSNDAENVNMLQRFHGNRIVSNTWDYGACHFQYGTFDASDNRLVTIDASYKVTSVGAVPAGC